MLIYYRFTAQVGRTLADGLHKEILGTLEFHEVGRTSPEGLHEETLGIMEFHEVGTNFLEVHVFS